MSTALSIQNQSQQLYTRAITGAWRRRRLIDPSSWLLKEPEIQEKMMRDADIVQALNARGHKIAGRQWTLIPRNETSAGAEMSVSVGTELLRSIKHFTEKRLLLASAFLSGSRIARIHGEARKLKIGDGRERVWWLPVELEDLDKRMFQKVAEHDPHTQEITAHWEEWHVGRAMWEPLSRLEARNIIRHTYQDDQATLGYGRGLREALGWWWYAKEHVFQESLQAVERFAQGLLTAKVDGARDAATGLPNEQLISDWTDMLEGMRARHITVYDKNDEIEMVPMSGEGWQLLETMRAELRTTITTLILGSNLPTTATEGGSYALAGIQENSTEALIQFDRETLEETLTDDLLGCVWFKNHPNLVELGIVEDKPRFSITQEKKEDPKEIADVAAVLHGMGVDLSAEDLYDRTGMKKPEPGEDIIPGATTPDPFGGGLGGFGLPGQPPGAPAPSPTPAPAVTP